MRLGEEGEQKYRKFKRKYISQQNISNNKNKNMESEFQKPKVVLLTGYKIRNSRNEAGEGRKESRNIGESTLGREWWLPTLFLTFSLKKGERQKAVSVLMQETHYFNFLKQVVR